MAFKNKLLGSLKNAKRKYDALILSEAPQALRDLVLPNSVYLGEKYRLKDVLEEKGALGKYDLELQPLRGHEDFIKMYSIASSSRLCFLHFLNKEIEYEHLLPIKGRTKAHYDAYCAASATYYECKCHEIFDDHSNSKLKCIPYKEIFEKMGYADLSESNGFLTPTFEELDIDELEGRSIYSLRFDFKQLLTHISGLFQNGKSGTIHYMIFTPQDTSSDSDICAVLQEIREEIKIICESRFVQKMKSLGIGLEIEWVPIDERHCVIL